MAARTKKTPEGWPRQHAPRYRVYGVSRRCECGHMEGTHNDLSYCTVWYCDCTPPAWPAKSIPGRGYGFRPVE